MIEKEDRTSMGMTVEIGGSVTFEGKEKTEIIFRKVKDTKRVVVVVIADRSTKIIRRAQREINLPNELVRPSIEAKETN